MRSRQHIDEFLRAACIFTPRSSLLKRPVRRVGDYPA